MGVRVFGVSPALLHDEQPHCRRGKPEGHRLLVSGVRKPSLNLSIAWELKDDHAVPVLLALYGRDGLTASEELAAVLFHRRGGAVRVLALGERIMDRQHGDDVGRHRFPPWRLLCLSPPHAALP